jgi:hypothetical protein
MIIKHKHKLFLLQNVATGIGFKWEIKNETWLMKKTVKLKIMNKKLDYEQSQRSCCYGYS